MKKFLIFMLVLVIFGQFSYQLNGMNLRTFGISFNAWKKKYEQNAKLQNYTKQIKMKSEYQKNNKEEEARRKIVQEYLLPLAGKSSILKDFYNRIYN
jgi:hypothetical protein